MVNIGIDPGVNTGMAIWDLEAKIFLEISCGDIYDAMDRIRQYDGFGSINCVYFEDARQRRWFGTNSYAKLQGAGSIKRESKLWEEWLKKNEIPFRAVAPGKGCTKISAKAFEAMTGWEGRTNEHGRDAAMIVFMSNNRKIL